MVKSRWDYGDAGDKYPLQKGEVWRVGNHWLTVLDHADAGEPSRRYLGFLAARGVKPDAVFVDPPWDRGNARAFRTKAFGESEAVDFDGLITSVLAAVSASGVRVFTVEMGVRNADAVCAAIASAFPGFAVDTVGGLYYKKKPCVYIVAGDESRMVNACATQIMSLNDTEAPMAFALACGCPVLYHPCMGRGLMATTAQKIGISSVGSELNPRRLAVTVDLLVKATGERPVLEGKWMEHSG